MKLLLTSQMLPNDTIVQALADLLGKPFAEANVAYIITSHNGATGDKSWFARNLMSVYGLGWKNFYMLDVAGLDGLPQEAWLAEIEASDVIVVGGGANYFLGYWFERTGLFERFPKWLETKVYVGASAGSMLAQQELSTASPAMKAYAAGNWDVDLATLGPEGRRSPKALGLVDFLIRPHYGSEDKEFITDELLGKVATQFGQPLYALDDASAIVVDGNETTVASEGNWKLFAES